MLKDQRIKKVVKQITGIDKDIGSIDINDFVHEGCSYYLKNRFSVFCLSKFFPIELSVYENHFFKNNYFVRPSYERDTTAVGSLNYKNILWVKFNLSTESIKFLDPDEIEEMISPENYFRYKNDECFMEGTLAAAHIIEQVLFSDCVSAK
ncbi:hypothetical protein AADV15_000051 [Campylobacter coli]